MLPSPIRTIAAPMPDMPVRVVDVPDIPALSADPPSVPVFVLDLPRTPLIVAALPQMPRVLIDGELIPIITQHWVAALNGEGTLGAELLARVTADVELAGEGGMVAVAIPRMFAVMALGGLGTLTASLKAKGPVVKTAQFKGVGAAGYSGGIGAAAGKAAFTGGGAMSVVDRALAYADAKLSGGATLTAAIALLTAWANASFRGSATLTSTMLATGSVADTVFRGAGLLNSATFAKVPNLPLADSTGSFGAQVKAILALSPQFSGLGSLTAAAMMRALQRPSLGGVGTASAKIGATVRGTAGSEGWFQPAQLMFQTVTKDAFSYPAGALPTSSWKSFSKAPQVKADGTLGAPNPGTTDGIFMGMAVNNTPMVNFYYQTASVTITDTSSTSKLFAGVFLRANYDTGQSVYAGVGKDGWVIGTTGGGGVQVRASGGGSNVLGERVTLVGDNGAFTLYRNGVETGKWIDTTGAAPAGLYAGVFTYCMRSFFSNSYGPDIDDYAAAG